ncbi:MAG: hypothetical protein RIE86_24020 [Imperialibacter sp.]|uniref:hypothetical protein n=1 Tax=Imperialibacter sp. TaxID=2038411 RepID=UPI0032ECD756
MIVLVEPLCQEMSHEKVNSGFIYGLQLAFPGEMIRMYAHATHIKAIKNVFVIDGIATKNIEYIPIKFDTSESVFAFIGYYFLLKRILKETIVLSVDKIFFLSFSPPMLFLIKKLKSRRFFSKLKFTFVLHAAFEGIDEENIFVPTKVVSHSKPVGFGDRMKKISFKKIPEIPSKLLGVLGRPISRRFEKIVTISRRIFNGMFPIKKMLLFCSSPDYRYVALAPYIREKAKAYIDVEQIEIFSVYLPTVFVNPLPNPKNSYPKFAIFGYGNSGLLQQLNFALLKKNIKSKFEIRIIGSDSRGTEVFGHVTTPIRGRRLTRIEMESLVVDIDFILILYEKGRYRLSCSASIMESLSYMKPIVHLDNDCINFFNSKERPIGIQCVDVDQMADEMASMIENFSSYSDRILDFRKNISLVRENVKIENSVTSLTKSFTWN